METSVLLQCPHYIVSLLHYVEQGLVDNTQTESSHRCSTQRALCSIERELLKLKAHEGAQQCREYSAQTERSDNNAEKQDWLVCTDCMQAQGAVCTNNVDNGLVCKHKQKLWN